MLRRGALAEPMRNCAYLSGGAKRSLQFRSQHAIRFHAHRLLKQPNSPPGLWPDESVGPSRIEAEPYQVALRVRDHVAAEFGAVGRSVSDVCACQFQKTEALGQVSGIEGDGRGGAGTANAVASSDGATGREVVFDWPWSGNGTVMTAAPAASANTIIERARRRSGAMPSESRPVLPVAMGLFLAALPFSSVPETRPWPPYEKNERNVRQFPPGTVFLEARLSPERGLTGACRL